MKTKCGFKEIIEQPKNTRMIGNIKMGGGKKSIKRLEELGFDPIEQLVCQYNKLVSEIEHQEKLRKGEIVELNVHGKPRAYYGDQHMALYDKLTAIADKLLRFGYSRVPETVMVEEKKTAPLVVNLTKTGDTYVINDLTKEEEE